MMSPFALARPPAVKRGKPACRAKTLLAMALLLPLAACAAQPTTQAVDGAAVTQAPAAPVPAPRQQEPATPVQDSSATPAAAAQGGTAPSTRASNAPARSTAAPAGASPAVPGSASGTPAHIPAPERATTVGEVPTMPGTVNPAPDAASLPGAPQAIPGTPARPAPMPQPAAGPTAGTLLQTILALALVLALLAALAWAMKRYGPKMTGSSANLKMVGALNIGGRERIMVIEVGDQWIVVGASPGRVNALATMPRGENAAATATLAGHTPSAATFSDWLKQTMDKRNAK